MTQDDQARVGEAVEAFFQSGGTLAQACVGQPFPYEPRPQQHQMALAVASALSRRRHLAVEAGTGVGKSFAYLVPLLLTALDRKVQAAVSTYTIALQEQLISKDLPFLREHLGVDFKAVLVKGRSNYICLRRLARAQLYQSELFSSHGHTTLRYLSSWAEQTRDGSLQELSSQPPSDVWDSVCCEQGNCLWTRCPEYSRCFLMRARSQIRGAHLLVLNHHLFFSDLVLRAQGTSFLPSFSLAVLDEAHMVESVATDHLGLRLSQFGFEHWMRRLYVPEKTRGLLAVLRDGAAANEVVRLQEALDVFFEAVQDWAKFQGEENQRLVVEPLPVSTTALEIIDRLLQHLDRIVEQHDSADLQAEVRSLARRGREMRSGIEAFLGRTIEDQVYWVEREGRRRRQVVLYSAPIEVAPALEEVLFQTLETVVLTSATMAVGGDMEYFQHRVGATASDAVVLGSPFDYGRQMKVLIPRDLPDPNSVDQFAPAAADAFYRAARAAAGLQQIPAARGLLARALAVPPEQVPPELQARIQDLRHELPADPERAVTPPAATP